ncbi:UDP-2,4-diacetamido-2,4,6-trideoxy-beta-L-altropyranose hydrolase [Alphaproteobacteria bacterium]|nr:UDP-2,4-diacetamido-2,4,6-trideoxy-beta-L-altropyranose hydrolase [Alphaproteobacteria bacterium]
MLSKKFNSHLIYFRFDCGPEIGMGHAIRCMAIVNQLQKINVDCAIFHRESSTKYLPNKVSGNIKYYALPDSQELFSYMPKAQIRKPDALIIDQYSEARENLSASIFKNTTKILIDDLDTEASYDCEILINPNIGFLQKKNRASQLQLLGPTYAPIREEVREFAKSWEPAVSSNMVLRCLISIGATDPLNLTSKILRSILDFYDRSAFHFIVILSSAAPHLNEVTKYCNDLRKEITVEVVIDPENIGEMYQNVHCCIGAAGSSAWERCCVGLPTAQIVVARNQQQIQDELVLKEAVVDLPHPDNDKFFDRLSAFLKSAKTQSEAFLALSKKCQTIVDGYGAKRIADAILEELSS